MYCLPPPMEYWFFFFLMLQLAFLHEKTETKRRLSPRWTAAYRVLLKHRTANFSYKFIPQLLFKRRMAVYCYVRNLKSAFDRKVYRRNRKPLHSGQMRYSVGVSRHPIFEIENHASRYWNWLIYRSKSRFFHTPLTLNSANIGIGERKKLNKNRHLSNDPFPDKCGP